MDIKLTPPAKIKGLLRDRKTSAAAIGRKLGVSRVYVHLVVSGVKPGKKVREFICREYGVPDTFWVEMDAWRKAA